MILTQKEWENCWEDLRWEMSQNPFSSWESGSGHMMCAREKSSYESLSLLTAILECNGINTTLLMLPSHTLSTTLISRAWTTVPMSLMVLGITFKTLWPVAVMSTWNNCEKLTTCTWHRMLILFCPTCPSWEEVKSGWSSSKVEGKMPEVSKWPPRPICYRGQPNWWWTRNWTCYQDHCIHQHYDTSGIPWMEKNKPRYLSAVGTLFLFWQYQFYIVPSPALKNTFLFRHITQLEQNYVEIWHSCQFSPQKFV